MSSAPLLHQLLSIFDLRVVDFADKKDKRFIFTMVNNDSKIYMGKPYRSLQNPNPK